MKAAGRGDALETVRRPTFLRGRAGRTPRRIAAGRTVAGLATRDALTKDQPRSSVCRGLAPGFFAGRCGWEKPSSFKRGAGEVRFFADGATNLSTGCRVASAEIGQLGRRGHALKELWQEAGLRGARRCG